jgi:hypothetical protein
MASTTRKAKAKDDGLGFDNGWAKCSVCGANVLPAPSTLNSADGKRYCIGTNRAGRDHRPANFVPAGVRGQGGWKATEGVPKYRQVKHGASDDQAWQDWDAREVRQAKAKAKAKTVARTKARATKAQG